MSRCQICKRKFDTTSMLLSHINIHIGRKCRTCNQIFKSTEPGPNHNQPCFQSHKWLVSQSQTPKLEPSYPSSTVNHSNFNNTTNDWHCQYCEYKTCTKTRLTKHMRVHTNERPYKCDKCGKRFTVQCNLNQHILSIHTKDKPYKCTECGLGFIRRDKLREHKRIHTGEKPFQCNFCEQSFARRSSLNKHVKIHVGFKCRFCANTFESDAQLKQHKKLVHSDKNPETGAKWFRFGCNLCQKRFFTKELLTEHLQLHTGFPCEKCYNVYESESALKEHKCKIFTVSNGNTITIKEPLKVLKERIIKESERMENKRHYCAECDRYFKSGQSLGGHNSRVHRQRRVKVSDCETTNNKKAINKKRKKKKTQKQKKREKCEQNELDILVETTQILRRNNRKNKQTKIGVNIFGEYDKEKVSKNIQKIEEINIIKSLKNCPARHGLKKRLTPDNRVFECDECNKTMYLNEEMFGCRYCDYDLCMQCYYGKGNEERKQNIVSECVLSKQPRITEKKPKIILSLKRNRKGTESNKNDSKNSSKTPPRKRRRLTIKIPRLKKNK